MYIHLDLTGGSAIWRIAAYSYLSDVSEPEMRTKRIAFCDGMFLLGFYIGNMLGGPVQHNLGYGYNFGFGMVCSLLAIAWCVFYVKDAKELRDSRLKKELGLNSSNDTTSDITKLSSNKTMNEQQEPKKNETGLRKVFLSKLPSHPTILFSWKIWSSLSSEHPVTNVQRIAYFALRYFSRMKKVKSDIYHKSNLPGHFGKSVPAS